jgi:hypothetical protein
MTLGDERDDPEISLIFAHGVGSLKELWDVPCPSPTGEPFGPRGGVVPTHSACWTWSVFNDHSG